MKNVVDIVVKSQFLHGQEHLITDRLFLYPQRIGHVEVRANSMHPTKELKKKQKNKTNSEDWVLNIWLSVIFCNKSVELWFPFMVVKFGKRNSAVTSKLCAIIMFYQTTALDFNCLSDTWFLSWINYTCTYVIPYNIRLKEPPHLLRGPPKI